MRPAVYATMMTLCLVLEPIAVRAHNVIAAVFPSGDAIEGEVGFSNGTMAVDQIIEVFDEAGNPLGQTVTDAAGFFVFTPQQPVTHVFRADMGAGHVAEVHMDAPEVAAILGAPLQAQPSASTAGALVTSGNNSVALSPETQAAIATMLRDELRPLRREITALRQDKTFQDMLGGVGYIVGLFGLGFYLAARKRLKGKA